MQYMLLIYGDESHWSTQSEDDQRAEFGKYREYTQSLRDRGALVAADPLQPTSTATTVRVRDGETLTTDGPFAETREQLGGYYVIEVDSLDEAIEWAAKVPAAQGGSIEVRPIMPMAVEAAQS